MKREAQMLGCSCSTCTQDRAEVESGAIFAVNAGYKLVSVAVTAGIPLNRNNHGNQRWVLLPPWAAPVMEMDAIGVGASAMVVYLRMMHNDPEFRDVVMAAYRLGGLTAAREILDRGIADAEVVERGRGVGPQSR